jgi:hypothetical protein
MTSESETQGKTAWDQLRFQYPDAAYTTDGWWWRGSLRTGDDPIMNGSLLALAHDLLERETSGHNDGGSRLTAL